MIPSSIILGSCEDLSAIKANQIALTVTSPPYWNAIDYDIHGQDSSQDHRSRRYAQGYENYAEFLEWLVRIFDGICQKTKPGGFACLVLGTLLYQKKHYPVPFDIIHKFNHELPWEFHQEIVWNKVTGGVKRFGLFIQKPFPGYFYPNIMTEYILVFRKPGASIFKERDESKKNNSKLKLSPLFTKEIANTVWHVAPIPPNQGIDHPCPFPEEIPHRIIQLYSYEGDFILDPFCGSGTTLKVAKHLNRNYIGYDIVEKYVEISQKRLDEPLRLRKEQLVAVFDKIRIEEVLSEPSKKRKKKRNLTPWIPGLLESA